MKNIAHKTWLGLVLILVVFIALAAILYRLGFRITYAPELANDWNAISAVAAWAGAIGTVAAVFSAIHVANQQNKIALFEKRYKIFQLYDSCKIFSELLESLEDKNGLNSNDIQVLFLAVFCDIPMGEKINDFQFLRMQYIMIIEQLKQSQFLFNKEAELHLQVIANCLQKLIESICHPASENQLTDTTHTFIALLQDKKYDKILEKMRNTLTLQ